MDELYSQDAAPAHDVRDLVPNPILCAGPDGRIAWINAAAAELLGRPASAIMGESFANLIPREGRGRHLRAILRARRGPARDSYFEIPLATERSPSHWIGVQLRRVDRGSGSSEWVASAHDLTPIHAELATLRRREKELSARIREASEAAQLKTDFLATLSQELRAPMNGVIGMSRLLLDSQLEGDPQTFAEIIHDSGERLLELVDDILDFSRLEAGRLEIASLDFDLRVLVDTAATMLAAPATAREIRFTSAVHHRVPSRLIGDPGRLRQLLLCLGTNAMRDTPGGEVELRVDLVEETAHRVALRFASIMRGVTQEASLASGDAHPILEAFVREDPTLIARHGGAGLALGISRRLVALMGGDLGLHVESERGTICWFRVPLAKQAERPLGVPVAAPARAVALKNLRVLVADDSTIARRALSHGLRGLGPSCDEAEDGLEALDRMRAAAAENAPYGLVLVDLDLPGLDAAAFASAVHNDPGLIATPLMLVTNFGRPGDAARAESWGYAAYLVKPVPSDQLEEAVREVIRRSAMARTGDAVHERAESGDNAGLVTRHTLAEQRRHRARVLVVEDNPLDQLVVCSALRRMGYEPQIVNDGAAALAAVEVQTFDIIFMDVRLPEMDGIEAVRAIRHAEEGVGRRTPVIAITSLSGDEDRERCLEAGMDEFLPKPLDLEAMCATVERWMRAAEESGRSPVEDTPAALDAPVAEPVAEPIGVETPIGFTAESNEEWVEAPVEQSVAPRMAEPPSEPPVLDPERLEISSMGSHEIRSMLVRAFFTHVGRPMERLRTAVAEHDADQVEFQSHGMKGMCASLGAMRCAALFEVLEQRGHERDLDDAAAIVERATAELKRVESLLGDCEREQAEAA